MIKWHRAFGLVLTDFFTGSNYKVEMEKELSAKQQFLDIVIIKKSEGKPIDDLPDGLEYLADHNVLTYKSLHQPMDNWAIEEVIGHYANYRKQESPFEDDLLPAADFQVYAVSTRYPQKLLGSKKHWGSDTKEIQAGVYQVSCKIIRPIIILVLNQMPQHEKNALWQLFSGNAEGFGFGDAHYQWHEPRAKSLLNQLYELYQKEGVVMPYTWDNFYQDYTRPLIDSLPIEERLRGIPPQEALKQFSVEERLKGIPPEEWLKKIPPEVLKKYLSTLS